jgi:hypothetical protein
MYCLRMSASGRKTPREIEELFLGTMWTSTMSSRSRRFGRPNICMRGVTFGDQ